MDCSAINHGLGRKQVATGGCAGDLPLVGLVGQGPQLSGSGFEPLACHSLAWWLGQPELPALCFTLPTHAQTELFLLPSLPKKLHLLCTK